MQQVVPKDPESIGFARRPLQGVNSVTSSHIAIGADHRAWQAATPCGKVPPEENNDIASCKQLYEGLEFTDDLTGAPLDKDLAIKARKLEMDYFKKMKVYTKVRRGKWMKVISTRWLDINKGDTRNPDYRARLVGREIKTYRDDEPFAATPPLESLRFIISICVEEQANARMSDNFVIMSNDVKRAYFYAPAKREIFVKIPDEDWEGG